MDLNGLRTEIFIQAVCGSTFKLELKVNWKQHKINTKYIGEKRKCSCPCDVYVVFGKAFYF